LAAFPPPLLPAPTPVPVPTIDVEFEYQRLPRALGNYAWWRPLLAVGLSFAFVIVATVVWIVAALTIGFLTGILDIDNLESELLGFASIDASSPFNLIVMLGSVAIWIPCLIAAVRLAGMRPWGHLSSVSLRIRWRWLLACLVPALAVMAFTVLIMLVVGPAIDGVALEPITIDPGLLAVNILIVVLLVPFQSAAEEFAFRGVLFQAFGSWIRFVWIAMIVTTLAFMAGHIYDIWGLIDVGVFGFAAAWLAWRTGGLEAAIVMHTVNNVVLFVILATGVTGGSEVTESGSSPVAILLTAVTMVAYCWWIDRKARRRGIGRSVLARVPVR
jgi:membrane protease YdiL (CAAX protease family)